MAQQRNRQPHGPVIETIDRDGRPIVRVPLPDGRYVKLFPRHYARLQRMGVGLNWFVNGNGTGRFYVRVRLDLGTGRSNNAQLARLITCPGKPGAAVTYRDGDPLNLRLDNLEVGRRKGRGKAREQFIPDDADLRTAA